MPSLHRFQVAWQQVKVPDAIAPSMHPVQCETGCSWIHRQEVRSSEWNCNTDRYLNGWFELTGREGPVMHCLQQFRLKEAVYIMRSLHRNLNQIYNPRGWFLIEDHLLICHMNVHCLLEHKILHANTSDSREPAIL